MSTYRTLSFDIHEDAVAMSFFIRHGDMYVFSTEKGLYTVTNGQCRFHGHLAAVGGVKYHSFFPCVAPCWSCCLLQGQEEGVYMEEVPAQTSEISDKPY